MGNQMFQYAFARTLSTRLGTELRLDTSFLNSTVERPRQTLRRFDLDLLNIEAVIARPSDVGRLTVFVDEQKLGLKRHLQKAAQRLTMHFNPRHIVERTTGFDPELVASIGKNAFLDGYWQSEKYFETAAETIRREFTFKNPISKKASELSREISSNESVALFVRRTDFVGNPAHVMLNTEQIERAVSYFKKRLVAPRLFVFSDEIGWCRENLRLGIPTFFVGDEFKGERFADQFQLLSMCLHFIIPISSYAWWAAWLAERPGKTVLFAGNDLYPDWPAKGWIEIGDGLD